VKAASADGTAASAASTQEFLQLRCQLPDASAAELEEPTRQPAAPRPREGLVPDELLQHAAGAIATRQLEIEIVKEDLVKNETASSPIGPDAVTHAKEGTAASKRAEEQEEQEEEEATMRRTAATKQAGEVDATTKQVDEEAAAKKLALNIDAAEWVPSSDACPYLSSSTPYAELEPTKNQTEETAPEQTAELPCVKQLQQQQRQGSSERAKAAAFAKPLLDMDATIAKEERAREKLLEMHSKLHVKRIRDFARGRTRVLEFGDMPPEICELSRHDLLVLVREVGDAMNDAAAARHFRLAAGGPNCLARVAS
jgi:hypothetical protein